MGRPDRRSEGRLLRRCDCGSRRSLERRQRSAECEVRDEGWGGVQEMIVAIVSGYGLNPTLFHSSAQLYITPLVMTYSTFLVLRMSSSGLPFSTIRSARLPFSIVPT